jgi:hypothetical protein
MFDGAVCDTDDCGIGAMVLCFGLWIALFFNSKTENNALFAIQEEGTKLDFGRGCNKSHTRTQFYRITVFGDQPMKKWQHAQL